MPETTLTALEAAADSLNGDRTVSEVQQMLELT